MDKKITIRNLIKRYWKKTSLTWLLVLMEGLLIVSIPIVIGWAVDDLMQASYTGLVKLGILCYCMLAVGSLRRFYDTRVYSKIYETVSCELVENETKKKSSISKITARANLFDEFIQFLEESIPDIINQFVSLAGTLIIIFFISKKVFLACLLILGLTMLVYKFSESKIYSFSTESNDELEKQVEIFEKMKKTEIRSHFNKLAKLQIAMSDLDTKNFSLIWIGLSVVLIFTIYEVTSSGTSSFGQIVSAVMYVFNLVENLIMFPIYYMELIRLSEIAERFES
jgi:ABC-type multidrug transport system fused ATPase/permease subunit